MTKKLWAFWARSDETKIMVVGRLSGAHQMGTSNNPTCYNRPIRSLLAAEIKIGTRIIYITVVISNLGQSTDEKTRCDTGQWKITHVDPITRESS